MSIQPMIDELHQVSDALTDLLDRETDLLRDMRPGDTELFAREKEALSMRYQQTMQNLMARGAELKEIDDEARLALRGAQARFKCAARRNTSVLKARMKVSQKLIDTVVGALKNRQQTESGVYNRHGTIGSSPVKGYAGVTQAPRISVSVDRKL